MMKISQITNSKKETQVLGKEVAKYILKKKINVIALKGDLGSGKTTFLQGFAKGLGLKENVLSPTFIIMRRIKNFYHIDCYRIKKAKELEDLGFKEIVLNKKNITAIEWPERIKKILPEKTLFLSFKFLNENKRHIKTI